MTGDRRERVHLTGDRDGAYVVAEARADGSLVLIPDASPSAHRRARPGWVDERGPLARLLGGRTEPVRTTQEALGAWGVELLDDETVVEFVMADVDERHGFVALTNRRFIFLVRGRTTLEPHDAHPLDQITSVERIGRGRKPRLVVRSTDRPPVVIESPDRSQLERLSAGLMAR